jgi:hypothetical protein
MLALSELLKRDRHRTADTAGQHDGLVVANEARSGLDRWVRFGFAVGDLKFDLFAQYAFAFLQGQNPLGDTAALLR